MGIALKKPEIETGKSALEDL